MIVAHAAATVTDASVAVTLVAGSALYAAGLVRRRAAGRTVDLRASAAFAAAVVVLAAALASPLEALATALFSAHMVQHLLLLLVAAPLLAVARPVRVTLAALPRRWRRRVHRLAGRPAPRAAGRLVHPVAVWVGATAVLWLWHLPVLYAAAVTDPLVHAVEHATLLATAALTWWLVANRRGPLAVARPAAVLLVFATGVQSAALGAVLALASAPLYPVHTGGAGMTPLADQQLAGALMWAPPALVYVTTMIVLLFRWLRDLDADRDRAAPTALREAEA